MAKIKLAHIGRIAYPDQKVTGDNFRKYALVTYRLQVRGSALTTDYIRTTIVYANWHVNNNLFSYDGTEVVCPSHKASILAVQYFKEENE